MFSLLKRNSLALASGATLYIASSFFITSAQASATLNSSPDLQHAIFSAIEKNPEVQEKWHEFLSSTHQYEGSRSGYKPKVDLGVGYDLHRNNHLQNHSYNGAFGEITLTQMLYDGALTKSEVSQFNNMQLVRYFELLNQAENTAHEALTAYLDVVRQRELVEIARETFNKHEDVYRQVEKSTRAGVSRSADLEQINGRLALAKSNLITEVQNLHDVSARYLRIIGEKPNKQMDNFTFGENSLPETAEQALGIAYKENPLFQAAMRNILASEDANKVAKSDFKPKVHLNARYGVQSYDSQGFNRGQSEGKIGVELRMNLYHGGLHKANNRKTLEDKNAALDRRDIACVNIRQEVQIAHNNSKKISDLLPILNQHRISSSKVATAYKQQFDIGQRTLLDVLDIENEYFQASRAYINSNFDLEIARSKTLASMGTLIQSLDMQKTNLPSLADLGAEPLEVDGESLCNIVAIDALDFDLDAYKSPVAAEEPAAEEPASILASTSDIDDCKDGSNNANCKAFDGQTFSHTLDVKFEHESDAVAANYKNDIKSLANYLVRNPETQVELAGHASLGGSDEYNNKLTQRRADAVADVLINEFGIDKQRITTKGYGKSRLIINERSDYADQINRRVEAIISQKQ